MIPSALEDLQLNEVTLSPVCLSVTIATTTLGLGRTSFLVYLQTRMILIGCLKLRLQ